MRNEERILKCNHEKKSLKVCFIIYAELEPLLERIDTCQNKNKKS